MWTYVEGPNIEYIDIVIERYLYIGIRQVGRQKRQTDRKLHSYRQIWIGGYKDRHSNIKLYMYLIYTTQENSQTPRQARNTSCNCCSCSSRRGSDHVPAPGPKGDRGLFHVAGCTLFIFNLHRDGCQTCELGNISIETQIIRVILLIFQGQLSNRNYGV